jgi:acetyl-CoA carboxylase carboxyltransferase component
MKSLAAVAPAAPGRLLSPQARLELLCDPGSVRVIRSTVTSRAEIPGDGVVAAAGTLRGRPLFCYSQDRSVLGGSPGEAHAESILRVLGLAGKFGAPVVGFVESPDAHGRVLREQARLSGVVPQVAVVAGGAAGDGVWASALTDFVVSADGSDHDAVAFVRELLAYLPPIAGEGAPRVPPAEPRASDPRAAARAYDRRGVIRCLADGSRLLELSPHWARNMVTALARIDGRAVGIVANQPRHLDGAIDADASAKAASFVSTCDAFGLPLLVLVDTPGFLPGTRQKGAGLLRAFAAAEVPKVTVILRRAHGGASIAMNSKDLGASFSFAWPEAEIGDHATAADAARGGHVDELVEPLATRERLAWALGMLA